jgi:hypothetical protein
MAEHVKVSSVNEKQGPLESMNFANADTFCGYPFCPFLYFYCLLLIDSGSCTRLILSFPLEVKCQISRFNCPKKKKKKNGGENKFFLLNERRESE